MPLFDIFKSKKSKKVEERMKRPSKGALKQAENAKAETVKAEKKGATEGKSELASRVILSPHITEKSSYSAENGVYVFHVTPAANKVLVGQAIGELYGLKPLRVRILNVPPKARFSRGKHGAKSGFKKAMVYLKKGDKIDIS